MSIVQASKRNERSVQKWTRSRAQQGTGVNRAPLMPGHLTEAQCDTALAIACGNASSKEDACELIDALGLTGYVPTSRRPEEVDDDAVRE